MDFLDESQIAAILAESLAAWHLDGARVLVITPDATRTAPLPLMFRLLHEQLAGRAAKLDFLVALGTHPLMDDLALLRLFGLSSAERSTRFTNTAIHNHRWDLPETFAELGVIPAFEVHELSAGLLDIDVPVRINRLVLDYDVLLVCGPVFPHEVVGFSGGNKYFFPGISGHEMIDASHWLGALRTSHATIGFKDTPVRTLLDRAASLIPVRRLALCMVVDPAGVRGVFAAAPEDAWSAAADLSARVHIRYEPKPYQWVLSVIPPMYTDLWTGAKGMYKLEPVVADGGEVILFAPHIDEISYTHGRLLDEIGYHVRDYFVNQWDQFALYPWGVLAHSTHLRGLGTFENGVERARIQVTLASRVPPERCQRLNLGYLDPAEINPRNWAGREDEGVLLVPHAGEVLYRLESERTTL
jgi:lactate racemase